MKKWLNFKPGKIFYGVSLLILVMGSIIGGIIVMAGWSWVYERVTVPGTNTIELNEPGNYIIFFEHKSMVDGKLVETDNINGLVSTLRNIETGEVIELDEPSWNTTYSIAGNEGEGIFSFGIDEIGKYELESWYEDGEGEEARLVISKGIGMLIRPVILSVVVFLVFAGVAITIFIVTRIQRVKSKNDF